MKITKNQSGIAHLALVLLLAIALSGVGFAGYKVYKSNQDKKLNQATAPAAQETATKTEETKKEESKIPESFVEYENKESGFKFAYPRDWGTVSVSRQALNNEKYENNLPYFIKFSNADSPTAIIIPADWQFNPPGASEWNYPIDKAILSKSGLKVVDDAAKTVTIGYSTLSGQVEITGVQIVKLKTVNASQVELHRKDAYEAKKTCLEMRVNEYNSNEDHATLACYTQTYRDNFVKVLQSFSQL